MPGFAKSVRPQPTLEIVGPAVHRADDVLRVAAALQQQRLAVAAHVRKEVYAALAADERLAVFRPLERDEVADVGTISSWPACAAVSEHRRHLARRSPGAVISGHQPGWAGWHAVVMHTSQTAQGGEAGAHINAKGLAGLICAAPARPQHM
jgi:hypothetical protein